MIDTHCHIHSDLFKLDPDEVIKRSKDAGIEAFICVGCDIEDSEMAVNFARNRADCYASIGIHPHEADHAEERVIQIRALAEAGDVVAIGEIGLDYWYENAQRDAQKLILRQQLQIAADFDLPVIFHVRGPKGDQYEAFRDFFAIFDEFEGIKGVIHSFTAGQKSLTGVLSRSLCVGVNGIATFTKDEDMLAAYAAIPLDRIVLETDAPFLTPVPKRGMVNTPEYMGYTADFLAELRGEDRESLIAATSSNAKKLFRI